MSKKSELMKIVNFDRENLHIFWTTWGILLKVSGKMWLMLILSHKKTGLQLLSRRHNLGKTTGKVKYYTENIM